MASLKRDYSFSEIQSWGLKQTTTYYSNLRDIFQKQIGRFATKYPEQAQIYQSGGYAFQPKVKDIQSQYGVYGAEVVRRELQFRIMDMLNWTSPVEVEGYKRPALKSYAKDRRIKEKALESALKSIQTLRGRGYEHIQKSTIKKFGRFMDKMREMYGKKLPNSEEMVEFFDSLKYNTKRKSTQFVVDLWKEFEENGYEPDYGNQDLFAT